MSKYYTTASKREFTHGTQPLFNPCVGNPITELEKENVINNWVDYSELTLGVSAEKREKFNTQKPVLLKLSRKPHDYELSQMRSLYRDSYKIIIEHGIVYVNQHHPEFK